jgi:hypothetical protein
MFWAAMSTLRRLVELVRDRGEGGERRGDEHVDGRRRARP